MSYRLVFRPVVAAGRAKKVLSPWLIAEARSQSVSARWALQRGWEHPGLPVHEFRLRIRLSWCFPFWPPIRCSGPSENHHNADTNFLQVRIFLLVSFNEVFKPVPGGLHLTHSWRQMESQDRLGPGTGGTAAVFGPAQGMSAGQRPNSHQRTPGTGRVGTDFAPRVSRDSAQDRIQPYGTGEHAPPCHGGNGGLGTRTSVCNPHCSGLGNNCFG